MYIKILLYKIFIHYEIIDNLFWKKRRIEYYLENSLISYYLYNNEKFDSLFRFLFALFDDLTYLIL